MSVELYYEVTRVEPVLGIILKVAGKISSKTNMKYLISKLLPLKVIS